MPYHEEGNTGPTGKRSQWSVEGMERIDTFIIVQAALERYYKRERMDFGNKGDKALLPHLVKSRQDKLNAEGLGILASHHDNIVGRILWIQEEKDGELGVYMDTD